MTNFYDQFNKDQLINEFRSVVSDAEALLKATANTSGDKIAEVRAKTEKSLHIAKEKLADVQNEVLAKTKAAAKVTDVYVHENPWRSIGLAASVGVVIGLLINRR